MIGQTVSHYLILEKLGVGGMGVVYKAKDTRLGRTVALKFLSPELTRDEEAKRRFVHEAQAASALQHHNICTIHDIDEAPNGHLFICMDCYDGETLKQRIAKGPLPVEKAIDVVIQIADGLAKAHGAGMAHRDIKPANIMVTNDGVVKIVDFGLAKLAGEARMTKTGTTVGTVSYMSPEQIVGDDVDGRSDIFSLGAVMYEVLTGHRAFPGDHEAAVLYSITHEEPVPVRERDATLPDRLQTIVERALKKDPAERYQSAAELLADLKSLQGAMATTASSISARRQRARRLAVMLPILALLGLGGYVGYAQFKTKKPVSVAPGEEFFVVAVAPFWGQNPEALEEGEVMQALVERRILEQLGGEKDVRVLGSKDVSEMPRSHAEAKALGKELGATIMLWGEVIVLRDEVEIQPYVTVVKQLRGAKDRSAGAVETSLGEPNQLSLRKTKAGEVGNIALYMAGIFYRKTDPEKALSLLRRISPPTSESLVGQGYVFENRGDWNEAQRMYEKAIEIDPNHAPACANMGNVYYRQRKYDDALTWYRKAIEIDPTFAPAYLNTGLVYYYQGKYDEALTWHKKAIEIDPSHAPAYSHMGFIYFTQGKYDEALRSSNKAVQIDSTDAAAYLTMGLVYSAQGKYDQALTYCNEAIGLDSTMVGAFDALGRVYMSLGKYSDALAPLRKAIQLVPDYTYYSLWYFISLHGSGAREEARLHIQERTRALEGDTWVIPVVRFYAGNITEDAVLEKARADDPREDKGMKCEAYAYIGMAHLVGALAPADTAKAVDYFQRCVQTGITDYVEYEFAKRAVERLATP